MSSPRTGAAGLLGLPREDRNFAWIVRMFARFAAVGYLAYLVLLMPDILQLAPMMAPWWTPTMVAAVFVPGLALGLATFGGGVTRLRVVAGLAALTFLVAVATWASAWDGTTVDADQGVWLAAFPGLAAIAAVLVWPARTAFAYMVIACVAVQVVNYVVRGADHAEQLLPEISFAIMFCSLFVGGAVMALRTGRLLDSSTEEAQAGAAAAAAQRARAVERERFDGLTHDTVMATLLVAARGGSADTVRELSTATLAELDDIRAGVASDRPFRIDQAVGHLRAAAAEADPSAGFGVVDETDGESGLDAEGLPAEVVRALGAAMSEALRNCVRHAGQEATHTVTVVAGRGGLLVRVSDDGVGFDPSAVPAGRLGLSASVRRRMARIPGGWALVDSAPGAGTTIECGWEQR